MLLCLAIQGTGCGKAEARDPLMRRDADFDQNADDPDNWGWEVVTDDTEEVEVISTEIDTEEVVDTDTNSDSDKDNGDKELIDKEKEQLAKDEADKEKTEQEDVTQESTDAQSQQNPSDNANRPVQAGTIAWSDSWQYANNSVIHSDTVKLYTATGGVRKNRVIAVNAGHGTSGGGSVKTLCHPDGSPKTTGGSTAAGETYAVAVSYGTELLNGMEEAKATLNLAMVVKETLLQNGYDVLMIRESEDAQIDNVGRTVFANNNADCHIALHYDSSESDKGFFYISVPNNTAYRSMEPVASHWTQHNALGEAIISGVKTKDVKIYGAGSMEIDLTQTSYSTIPSVDLEVGDRASDCSEATLSKIASGISQGLDNYFVN